MRAISSITSISRVTSRKRGRRHAHVDRALAGARLEAEAVEDLDRARERDLERGDRARRGPCARAAARAAAARPRRRAGAGVMRAPQSSTMSRAAAREAIGASVGSTPFSQRFEPSVRRPSVCDVRRIWARVKFAASSTIVVGVVADLGVGAAHDAGDALRALGVGDHEHRRVELALLPVERAQRLARPRAARRQRVAPRMRAWS